MRQYWLASLFLLFFYSCFTQTGKISLQEAHQLTMAHHPLGAQRELLRQSSELQVQQLENVRLPDISLQAETRVQSENIQLPFEVPGQPPIELPLFNFQTAVDLQYTIYDGGATAAQKALAQAKLATDQQSVETELYRLRERVDEVFFSILQLRSRKSILETNLDNLESRIEQLEAGLRHGTVLSASVDQLRVEALRLESKIEETRHTIRGLTGTLSELTGVPLTEEVELTLPDLSSFSASPEIERPEQKLFQQQKQQILAREQLLAASRKPKVSAFARGGFGYPNPLNIFDDNFSPFGLAGLRFNWKIFDWNNTDIQRQELIVQSHIVENRQEAFEYNIRTREEQFQTSLAALRSLVNRDEEIVRLQNQILQQTGAQLDRGVITPADYLEQTNAAIEAQLTLENRRLELEKTKVDYLIYKGLWQP